MKSAMKTIAGFAVLCLAAALLVAGCMSSAPQKTYEFNESNNEDTVDVTVGSEMILSLDENPTTGFEWNMTITGLEIVNDEYLPSDTSGQMVGSGGTHVWYLKANEVGTATIMGIYKRSWEETTGEEMAFDMTVRVI